MTTFTRGSCDPQFASKLPTVAMATLAESTKCMCAYKYLSAFISVGFQVQLLGDRQMSSETGVDSKAGGMCRLMEVI